MTYRMAKHAVAAVQLLIFPLAIGINSCGTGSNSSPSPVTPPSKISVTISLTDSQVAVGGTTPLSATVANDSSNQGVTWSLTQGQAACVPSCGTLSSAASMSGSAITYTAPAAVPANPSVTITATSVAAPGASKSASITIVGPTIAIAFNPSQLDFGTIPVGQTSAPLSTTMTNAGSSTLHIDGIALGGSNPADYTETNSCGASLAGSTSCTIIVTFRPSKASFDDADVFVSDSAEGSPQTVSLLGKGKKDMASGAVQAAVAKYAQISSPDVTGPHGVGTRIVSMTDYTRDDPYATDGPPRSILVRFWYPAQANTQCQPADYASPRVWRRFSQLIGAPLPNVSTNSCIDAPVSEGAHPVVVFTPGFTGTFTDYTFLFEDLASWGYVVASVAHTYETTAVEFPHGQYIQSVLGSYLGANLEGDAATMSFAVSVRLADLRFVLNELSVLNADAQGPFGGRLDTDRVALAGHSLGGVTTLLGVEQDTRFRAGILIDGAVPNGFLSTTQTPIMFMGMGRQHWSEGECRLWSELRGPRFAVNFAGAEHLTPSDALWIARGAITPGNMSVETTLASIRDYVVAFLDANLRGETWSPLLLRPAPEYPGASVSTQNDSLCHGTE